MARKLKSAVELSEDVIETRDVLLRDVSSAQTLPSADQSKSGTITRIDDINIDLATRAITICNNCLPDLVNDSITQGKYSIYFYLNNDFSDYAIKYLTNNLFYNVIATDKITGIYRISWDKIDKYVHIESGDEFVPFKVFDIEESPEISVDDYSVKIILRYIALYEKPSDWETSQTNYYKLETT